MSNEAKFYWAIFGEEEGFPDEPHLYVSDEPETKKRAMENFRLCFCDPDNNPDYKAIAFSSSPISQSDDLTA